MLSDCLSLTPHGKVIENPLIFRGPYIYLLTIGFKSNDDKDFLMFNISKSEQNTVNLFTILISLK